MSPLPHASPSNDGHPLPADGRGEPVGGPLTVPGDAGPGWLRTAMDAAASEAAARLAGGPVLAVAASKAAFLQEIAAGDAIRFCFGDVRYGTTSLTLSLAVWIEDPSIEAPSIEAPSAARVTAADFTFIAVDGRGRPRPVLEPVAKDCEDPVADRAAGDTPWTPPT